MRNFFIGYRVSGTVLRSLWIIAACSLLFVSSCNKKAEIPPDILPKEKMTKVLSDIHEVESLIQFSALERNDSTKAIAYGYYKQIFQKNNITAEQFRRSFNFYADHLDLLDGIYEEVMVDLSKKQVDVSNR